jgi:predicted RecA/RadA family phage recombinase
MQNYAQMADLIPLVAPYTLASGNGFQVGGLFAVATAAAANGAVVIGKTQGVIDLPKATGALTQGAIVYWDNTARNVTATAGSNLKIGHAIVAALSGDAVARIRLNGAY